MTNAYQLKNIRFSYDQTPVLSIDTFKIRAQKITALIGPNGCGKSTLLNLLAFLQKSQQGKIAFYSELAVGKQQIQTFIKRIAFLPAKPYMLRGSVADNLGMALKFHQLNDLYDERINKVLEELDITHLVDQKAKALSSGEQQKVALARAIITDPDVLLMDEPFSYLDQNSEDLLEAFIHRYKVEQKKTIVFSTHNRLQGVALADDVFSLMNGRVANTSLINFFQGKVNQTLFDTGKIKIKLAGIKADYQYVSINPKEIKLSTVVPNPNAQNNYQGRVTAIIEEGTEIRVTVVAGEKFQVILSLKEYKKMDISIGVILWLSFQSQAILMF